MTGTQGYYIYLLSSLPMLQFGMKIPLSFEKFLSACEGLIPEKDMNIIRLTPSAIAGKFSAAHPMLKKWCAFDIAFRNELVKIRASRKKIDPAPYLRHDGYDDPSIAHKAMAAHRVPSIMERERVLDEERWHFLDELSFGHYFDLDALVIYALKLLILEKWEKVRTADALSLIKETAGSIK